MVHNNKTLPDPSASGMRGMFAGNQTQGSKHAGQIFYQLKIDTCLGW